MQTIHMTERIALVSNGRKLVNGVSTDTAETVQLELWAEVPKMPVREARDPHVQVGFRKDKPTFLVRYLTEKEIDPKWKIRWRGGLYSITGLDPDFLRKDITTITAERVS